MHRGKFHDCETRGVFEKVVQDKKLRKKRATGDTEPRKPDCALKVQS